jgi:hypothetical protein
MYHPGVASQELTGSALSAAMDLYLAVYPAVILARLQMNIKKKMALATALGIGSVSCVVAAYKCTRLPGLATDDFSCKRLSVISRFTSTDFQN